MAVSVEYHPAQLELRINGIQFRQVWLVTYQFENVLKYAVAVEDPTFGRFEISSNMILEWKSEGRWFQTKPQLVVEQLLTHRGGQYGIEEARRGRRHDGSGDPS
jgi:hypothetical protein